MSAACVRETSDSRFEAIFDEIIHLRPATSVDTLNVHMSLKNKPLVLVLSRCNTSFNK